MQIKTALATLFIVLAVALPQPNDISSTVSSPKASRVDGEASILARDQKIWQAAGGCKEDWDEDNRCQKACIAEAFLGECPGMVSMAWALTGGCIIRWYTCECICEWE
ncbi:hypothetical protein BKA67DRAFT_570789 [Truncatella angustata]|uniref:Invertebrate defensins family profile domain-containing protein n=1 Tax=Truncatella angustata TaxID=152316 RepID=A0A9P8UK99_9PEZI|nr:uncharacterized protein BKA67DRAFT_570789 [Truncatella angustata]KAH6653661.1 hypothetical protein BKA67DRAFT_570789 [Truncatella angustata]